MKFRDTVSDTGSYFYKHQRHNIYVRYFSNYGGKMTHKYGIIQSTTKSCIFYKQDEDGNQSTFNLFISPETESKKKKTIFAFIDNEQMGKESWSRTRDLTVQEICEAFGAWASDAPFLFELDAHKSIGHCLDPEIKTTKTK